MTKDNAVKSLFNDLQAQITSFNNGIYSFFQVVPANTGFKLDIQKEQIGILFWQILDMSGSKRRDYSSKSTGYSEGRNNVLQIDLYIKDMRLESETEEEEYWKSYTRESSNEIRLLIDRFFRIGENKYNFGYMSGISNWALIPTMFSDNRFVERWVERFAFGYIDRVEIPIESAEIGNIEITEV